MERNDRIEQLIEAFHQEMLEMIARERRLKKGSSTRFEQGVRNKGGRDYVKELLARPDSTFTAGTWNEQRDLNAEHWVLQEKYVELFLPEEKATAARRMGIKA
jgi:hypothetical protein